MQSHAKVVFVGGGCVGASVLYGLTERGGGPYRDAVNDQILGHGE